MILTIDSLWGRVLFWLKLSGRSFARSWGRDVMLYTGGVSFFALLAVFPAIAILIGLYKVGLSISEVNAQATALADVMPAAARGLFLQEITRLANTSGRTVSFQSALALIIGAYAAHRGFKALLAGLNLIHDEAEPHGFLKFNLLAFFVALFGFGLFTVVSGAVVTARLLSHAEDAAIAGESISPSATFSPMEVMLPAIGLSFGLTLLYRYAMSHKSRVAWRPAITGGILATLLSMISSVLCAIYVEQIAILSATYGSVGAVVVLLIWLSWNVNAIFYGGAFATEMENVVRAREQEAEQATQAETEAALTDTDKIVSLTARRQSRQ